MLNKKYNLTDERISSSNKIISGLILQRFIEDIILLV